MRMMRVRRACLGDVRDVCAVCVGVCKCVCVCARVCVYVCVCVCDSSAFSVCLRCVRVREVRVCVCVRDVCVRCVRVCVLVVRARDA